MADIVNGLKNFPEDEAARSLILRRAHDAVHDLWHNNPEDGNLIMIAQALGDAARTSSNRVPLGESGLLDLICALLPDLGHHEDLTVQFLRIIGNGCADTDENRAKVVASGCLPSIIGLVREPSLRSFALSVLNNILVDYEPAQKAVFEAGIIRVLIELLSGSMAEEGLDELPLMQIMDLLEFVSTCGYDSSLVHPDTPQVLLRVAVTQDQTSPDFLSICSVALAYLLEDAPQEIFLKSSDSIFLILRIFEKLCTNCDVFESSPDTRTKLKQIQVQLTAILADLSANPLFASSCPLDSKELEWVRGWLIGKNPSLQSGASLILGNIARSDENCAYLVEKLAVHKPLITILSDPSNTDAILLHSSLSFLKNLAIRHGNKAVLGSAGLFDMNLLPRFWDLDTQAQVQFDAVTLTRLLLSACPDNVRRICAPIVEDPEAPEHTRTRLHILIDLNKRADNEPTVLETGRAIALVCEIVNGHIPNLPSTSETQSPTETTLPSLETFYATYPTITDALFPLAAQSKFPTLRVQLTLTLAIMARAEAGAAIIAKSLHQPEKVSLITDIVNEAPGPERQNTLVLIAELLKRCPEELPEGLKDSFVELLRVGGERVLREQEGGSALIS